MTRTGCLFNVSNCSALSPARAISIGYNEVMDGSAWLVLR